MALYELTDEQVDLLRELVVDEIGVISVAREAAAERGVVGFVLRELASAAARLENCRLALQNPAKGDEPDQERDSVLLAPGYEPEHGLQVQLVFNDQKRETFRAAREVIMRRANNPLSAGTLVLSWHDQDQKEFSLGGIESIDITSV